MLSAQSIHDNQSAFSFVPIKECYACKQELPEPNYANKQWHSPKGRCRACIRSANIRYESQHENAIEGLGQHERGIIKSRVARARLEQRLRRQGYAEMILSCRLESDVHWVSTRTVMVDYRALLNGIGPERVIEAIREHTVPEASDKRRESLQTKAEIRLREEYARSHAL